MHGWPPLIVMALAWPLIPVLGFGLAGEPIARRIAGLPATIRFALPALCGVSYWLVAHWAGIFSGRWLALYTGLPVAVTLLLYRAARSDPGQRGNWRDFAVLLTLGLAVDLRWFEPAWPARLAVINKLLLLDTGLYGFFAIRQLAGAGFDLRLRLTDLKTGLRELAFYAPVAILPGLATGFLHPHAVLPTAGTAGAAWIFTFLFIAVPEEIFFRGWMQNLLERRLGRKPALWITAALFGLSHFNKRAAYFNWRYVLLAAIAGIFYGRAWRDQRRVGASAITHACADTIWSLWLR